MFSVLSYLLLIFFSFFLQRTSSLPEKERGMWKGPVSPVDYLLKAVAVSQQHINCTKQFFPQTFIMQKKSEEVGGPGISELTISVICAFASHPHVYFHTLNSLSHHATITFIFYLAFIQRLSSTIRLSRESVFIPSASCVCLFDTLEKRDGACVLFALEKTRVCLPTSRPGKPSLIGVFSPLKVLNSKARQGWSLSSSKGYIARRDTITRQDFMLFLWFSRTSTEFDHSAFLWGL